MGSEAEKECSYTPKLALFSSPQAHMQSPKRSGTLTPPLQASASVPFRWEEEPGKPKPCATLTIFSNPDDLARKCLELPPRLLHDAKNSPALEGARFHSSSSFRMGGECYGSFRGGSRSPERVQLHLGTVVPIKRGAYKAKGFLGSWRRRLFKARRDVGGNGNSYVFPSSGGRDSECSTEEEGNSTARVKNTRIERVGSFRSALHSKSKFWKHLITLTSPSSSWDNLLINYRSFTFFYGLTNSRQLLIGCVWDIVVWIRQTTIYKGFKLSVPWSKREKKDGFMG